MLGRILLFCLILAAVLDEAQAQGVAALQQQGMTSAQIHQRYPYYDYFQRYGSQSGPQYLYYNGYSMGDGKGESTWEKSVHSGIPGFDQQTLQARGRQYFPGIDQSQLQQFHRPLYVDPRVSQALDLSQAHARLQQPLPAFQTPSFQGFNSNALQGIERQLFFPGR